MSDKIPDPVKEPEQFKQWCEDHRSLEFVRDTSLEGFGKALRAYADLVKALTGEEPTYRDFTAFLEREGYVK